MPLAAQEADSPAPPAATPAAPAPPADAPAAPAAPTPPADAAPTGSPASFDSLRLIAAEMASKPYQSREQPMPPSAAGLSYDDFRRLNFREDHTLWRDKGLPFGLQMFGRGWLFKVPVEINLIQSDGSVAPLTYDPAQFKFDPHGTERPAPADLGYAGFKILHPLNFPDKWDELAAFLGASYFRVLSQGQVYGASARTLAIDTALPTPEEFPVLTRFWIRNPQPDDKAVEVLAILDSPSVAGACRYLITPGPTSTVDVTLDLHARTDIAKLALAPITSMFLFGERSDKTFDDFRPEVHDSDGLLVHDPASDNPWTFHPLNNPRAHRTLNFPVKQLGGFGLIQRDRNPDHYLDLEAHYHRRPGVWVEPTGNWPAGHVELFELPSELEYHDNANAYFVVKEPLKAGARMSLTYRLHWISGDPSTHEVAKAVSTRRQSLRQSKDGREGEATGHVRYLIDFAGPSLSAIRLDQVPQLWVDVDAGRVIGARAEPNPYIKGWRLVFELDPQDAATVNIRAGFAVDDKPLTETWSERWVR
jgi:glucans biosynthesis protein